MSRTYGGRRKSRRPKKTGESKTVDEIVRELRKNISPASNYRERSLSIHGLLCAKCGREFGKIMIKIKIMKQGSYFVQALTMFPRGDNRLYRVLFYPS